MAGVPGRPKHQLYMGRARSFHRFEGKRAEAWIMDEESRIMVQVFFLQGKRSRSGDGCAFWVVLAGCKIGFFLKGHHRYTRLLHCI